MWNPTSPRRADADGCRGAGGSLKLACGRVLSGALTNEVAHLDALSVHRSAHRGLGYELLVLCWSRERRKL